MNESADQTETIAGSTSGAPAGDATPPNVLGDRYLLEEEIASGGMASVWRAHDEVLARTVAVKLLHDHLAVDAAFRERFRREAIAAAKLTHPNVVSVYDTGRDGRRTYLVMEFVDGVTLRDVIADLGALEPGQVAAIGEKVARALAYAHERGLVHRDVKPANILIGSDGTVKVADFGIAKAEEGGEDLTRTGTVLGTAAYVAPEQITGEGVDGRADQYALGCVLYEALTGQQPFKGESAVATAAQRLERDPLPVRSLRPDNPRGLSDVVARAMRRAPADRYRSCLEMADELALYADDDTGETAALVPAVAAEPWRPQLPREPLPPRPVPAPAGRDSFLRTEGRWLAPVLALLLLVASLVGLGLATGILEPEQGLRLFARDGQHNGRGEPQLVPPAGIHPYDPLGDRREHDTDLTYVLDGNPNTWWRTEGYNTPELGLIKEGVGFYVDLGATHEVSAVTVTTVTPGISYEVRVPRQADGSVPGDPGQWQPVGRAQEAPATVTIRPDEPVMARYVLIWVTGNLQPGGGRYRAAFSGMAVQGTRR